MRKKMYLDRQIAKNKNLTKKQQEAALIANGASRVSYSGKQQCFFITQ